MAIKQERVVIGDSLYIITQLGAVEGRALFKKFATAIGPLLRDVFSGPLIGELQSTIAKSVGVGVDAAAQGEQGNSVSTDTALRTLQLLAPLVLRAIEDLPDALFDELCTAFAKTCQVQMGKTAVSSKGLLMPLGDEAVFDQHFAGEYVAMTQWLAQCVKVNGFLGKLGAGKKAPEGAEAAA